MGNFLLGDIMIIESLLMTVIPYLAGLIEIIGVLIISLGCLEAFLGLLRSGFDFGDEDLKIGLARALALSLEFKLAAEILKTVVVRSLDEFITLAAIVILRVVITFVLHWEIKSSDQLKDLEDS